MRFKKQRLLVIILASLMVVGLIGCTTKGPSGSSALFKAGTYATEADGYGGKIKVETTFSDKEIVKVEIVEDSETVGIGSNAIDKIPSDIVESQSLGVDAVSGATVTSEAIIEAVSKAVEEAGGDVNSLK
ncbi:MAG: FMN-binding protein [Tissierellaceae bacterium]|nr:FMN-binding protein [Tissierellaceae bacterium]